MVGSLRLVEPRFLPPLDAGFRPAVLANRAFQAEVEASRAGVPLVFGLERPDGSVSRFETWVFPRPDMPKSATRFAGASSQSSGLSYIIVGRPPGVSFLLAGPRAMVQREFS